MSHSLQMQQSVDKQIQDKFSFRHLMRRSLFGGFVQADEYFATCLAECIGKDVWGVGFAAELLVEFLSFFGPNEYERHVPSWNHSFGDGGIGETRRRAPREIVDVDNRHRISVCASCGLLDQSCQV